MRPSGESLSRQVLGVTMGPGKLLQGQPPSPAPHTHPLPTFPGEGTLSLVPLLTFLSLGTRTMQSKAFQDSSEIKKHWQRLASWYEI